MPDAIGKRKSPVKRMVHSKARLITGPCRTTHAGAVNGLGGRDPAGTTPPSDSAYRSFRDTTLNQPSGWLCKS
jgi:hypothetical protein